jgi:hypothetical protein
MKQIQIITLLVLGMLISSCGEDYLDPTPVSSIGSNGFYTNESEIEAAVLNIYDGLQLAVQREFALVEMRSDNSKTRSSEGDWAQFETLNVKSTNTTVAEYWALYYNVIFRANTVLEHLDAAGNSTDQFEGEAKFARALSYFNLVRLYGDVPLIDKVIGPTDTDYFDRDATADVYALIVSDLKTAVANLDNTYKGRASKAGAQALLAKVYLTLKNYGDAQDLLEDVIAGSSALPSFSSVFYTELNSEIIFAIEYTNDAADDSQDFSIEFTQDGRVRGLNYATPELITAFNTFGGAIRTTTSIIYDDVLTKPVTPDPLQDYKCGKFVYNSTANNLNGNDWIVLRMADVLLMHVEAILAGADVTSSSSAIASFKKVRDRAGITTPITSITKQELLDERRVELAFENQRWFDLIRFGVAESVLGTFATDNGIVFSASDLLLPIPQREIGVSFGKLTQNPGY